MNHHRQSLVQMNLNLKISIVLMTDPPVPPMILLFLPSFDPHLSFFFSRTLLTLSSAIPLILNPHFGLGKSMVFFLRSLIASCLNVLPLFFLPLRTNPSRLASKDLPLLLLPLLLLRRLSLLFLVIGSPKCPPATV